MTNPNVESQYDQALLQSIRRAHPASDDLRIYKAKIYKVCGKGDDRLQVLPISMFGIERDEMDNLPRYPSLIKGTTITGKSIDEFGEEEAESVWVLATPDFTVGFVVGKCNSFGENTDVKWPYSYAFDSVMDFLFGRRVNVIKDYNRYEVIMTKDGEEGGMINLVDRMNGDWILFNKSGTVIAVTQQKLYMRCGTPPNPSSAGPVAFSMIELTPNAINMKSPNILLDGKQLTVGHHGLHLLGAPTKGSMTTQSGHVITPIDNTHA